MFQTRTKENSSLRKPLLNKNIELSKLKTPNVQQNNSEPYTPPVLAEKKQLDLSPLFERLPKEPVTTPEIELFLFPYAPKLVNESVVTVESVKASSPIVSDPLITLEEQVFMAAVSERKTFNPVQAILNRVEPVDPELLRIRVETDAIIKKMQTDTNQILINFFSKVKSDIARFKAGTATADNKGIEKRAKYPL